MNWMIIKRVFIAGGKNFSRGGAVSMATVLIMTVTLAIIGSLIFLSALLSYTLGAVKDKVDVSVYFVTTASESEILAVKDQLEKLPQVESVAYTSAADALTAFRERHANDQLTLQALDELGANPLDASLEVRAKDPSEYESIVSFLEASPALSAGLPGQSGASIVDRINYAQNKEIIDRLSLAINATREIGLAVVILFAIASILNTTICRALAFFDFALESGEIQPMVTARETLAVAISLADNAENVPMWWVTKLCRNLVDDLWAHSLHENLPLNAPEGAGERYSDLRRLFIGSLYARRNAEVELWPSQREAAKRSTDLTDDLVVALPTSAGKTRVAEIAALMTLATGKRVLITLEKN